MPGIFNKMVTLRLTEEEREMLKQKTLADDSVVTLNDYVRKSLGLDIGTPARKHKGRRLEVDKTVLAKEQAKRERYEQYVKEEEERKAAESAREDRSGQDSAAPTTVIETSRHSS